MKLDPVPVMLVADDNRMLKQLRVRGTAALLHAGWGPRA
jgi:hypothetical protein